MEHLARTFGEEPAWGRWGWARAIMPRETQAGRRGAKQRVKARGERAAAADTLSADLAQRPDEPNQLPPEDGGVSWADVKLFFFTWAALVALFGLGGYLLYEDEYQRQLQEHLMNKGLSNSKEGRWEEAIASYTAVLDKDREHSVALTNRGMAYASTGQVTIGAASTPAAPRPPNARAWRPPGRCQRGLNSSDSARTHSDVAALGQDTEAMLDFTTSLAAAGRQDATNRLRTLYNRGLVYIRLNYLNEALGDLSEVLEKSAREYADAYTRRGEVFTLQGKWKEAQQDFHNGCRLNQEESCARRESL